MSGRFDPAMDPWREAGQSASAQESPGASPATPGGSEPEAAPILTDLAALQAERDEYLGALQRLKADFDNYRKRVLRQQEEQAARAASDLVGKLLPVLDNLDLAWAHLGNPTPGADDVSEEVRALAQARQQILEVLAREGLERVDEAEVPFDPTVHDAVAHAPADGPATNGMKGDAASPSAVGDTGTGTSSAEPPAHSGGVAVDEVMRAGYRWRGHVLRPAMVRVRG